MITHRFPHIKPIFYRLFLSVITFLIALLLTGKLEIAAVIGLLDMAIKALFDSLIKRDLYQSTFLQIKPSVIWLTGLSGSGKTTIANDLIQKLKKSSINPVHLDGDEIRRVVKQTGFDEESRKKHNLSTGYIASLFEERGNVVVVSLISPYDDIRSEIRKMCKNFIEVYISTDLEICIQRDPKGLYRKALTGDIQEFTGISSPYYPPSNPEIKIDTSKMSVSQCSDIILQFLQKSNMLYCMI